MTPERYRQVEELLGRVLEHPEEERGAFLDEACVDDPELRQEVESLLAMEDRASELLDEGAVRLPGAARAGSDGEATDPWIGQRIGEFQLRGLLGAGGMGRVYEAWQENPGRTVAVKLLGHRLAGADEMRRFEREAEILARLQHPGIAHVYASGTVADPLLPDHRVPWFAMALVPEARSLTAYARAEGLSLHQRVELFLAVCEAVQHAHHQGILHRDLKPSNLLVGTGGRPQVIDFGVARTIDAEAMHTRTDAGTLVGTLQYMSPQQCSSAAGPVDIRSDVYSLGAVLYQLATDHKPHDLGDSSVYDAVRIICEQPPVRPSHYNPACRGDLETILGKALAKEPDQRYATVDALAQDLRRWLRREPILARPASAGYRARLFARRNPLAAAGLVLAILAVLGGAAVAGWFGWSEARARREAEAQTRITGQINEFLNEDLLRAADPMTGADPDLKVRDALAAALEKVSDRFPDEPRVEAGILHSIASAYHSLGLPRDGLVPARRAVALLEEHGAPDPAERWRARRTLLRCLADGGEYEEAEPLVTLLDRTVPADDDADRRRAMLIGDRAELWRLQGRYEEALEDFQEARRRFAAMPDPDQEKILALSSSVAETLRSLSRFDESLEEQRAALERSREAFGPEHPRTLVSMGNLAILLQQLTKVDEARELLEEATRISARRMGPEHINTLTAQRNLAQVYRRLGRQADARREIEAALAHCHDNLGPEHRLTMGSELILASVLDDLGADEEACRMLEELSPRASRVLGAPHSLSLEIALSLGRLLMGLDRPDEAREVLEAAIEATGGSGEERMALMNTLAGLEMQQGELEAAEELLFEVTATMLEEMPVYVGTGIALRTYGECLRRLERLDEAEETWREAYHVLAETAGPRHGLARGVADSLVRLFERQERDEDAQEWRRLR